MPDARQWEGCDGRVVARRGGIDERRAGAAMSTKQDADKDGPSNLDVYGAAPSANATQYDQDGDGLEDRVETLLGMSDPTKADTDGDGILDGAEDSDEDGLSDRVELLLDPARATTPLPNGR